MLLELTIKNVALVRELHAEFGEGLTIFTGETGAGKSILIGALTMLMGARAEKENIAHDAQEATVEGVFDVLDEAVLRRLKALDLALEDGDTLTVMRRWSRTGRGVCRINGQSVPASALRELGLIDIFGQMDHQSLRNRREHALMLDAYGDYADLLDQMRSAYFAWKKLDTELRGMNMDDAERMRRLDMLRFQTEEIALAELDPQEEEELRERRALQRNARQIGEALAVSHAMLSESPDDEAPTVLDLLRSISQQLSGNEEIAAVQAIYEQVEEALYQLEDVDAEIQNQLDALEFDENAAAEVEDRLALIGDLKRKYGQTVEAVLAFYAEALEELEGLESHDARLEETRMAEKKARKSLREASDKLHEARLGAAERFAADMLTQLADLGMGKTRFSIQVEKTGRFSARGEDEIAFLISPNPGIPLSPLEKTASGGEMSRIMLALKSVNIRQKQDICMVFDEIDTGVSGQMAQAVAEKLLALSHGGRGHANGQPLDNANGQILCVTHLQQLASMGDHHFLVEKTASEDSTSSNIYPLEGEARVNELARLVGGSGETSIEHARALLDQADAFRTRLGSE